jgi:glucose/arabinose dehydrogenase
MGLLDATERLRKHNGRDLTQAGWERLVRSGPVVLREVVAAAVALVVTGTAVFGSHVRDGGLYNDDWAFAREYRFAEPGIVGAVDAFSWMSFRPVATLYWPFTHAAFGVDPSLHLSLVLAVGVATSVALYVVLRMLDFAPLHAFVISALALVFPFSDAARLWAASSIAHVGITFYFLGLAVGLRGMRLGGRRAALVHAVAVSLYVASVFSYEIAAGAVMLSGLVYRLRGSWRRVAPRSLADAAVMAVVLIFVTSGTWNEPQPLTTELKQAGRIVKHSVTLFADAAVPIAAVPNELVIVAAFALLVAAVAVARRLDADAAPRRTLERWLAVAAGSVLAVGAGYLMFIPADPGAYAVLAPGQGNRINALAAPGYVALLYALVMLGATLVSLRAPRLLGAALAAAAVVAVGAAYVEEVADHKRDWARAAVVQRDVLDTIERLLPDPPQGSVVFAYGYPVHAAPNVPTFASIWDLSTALVIRYDDDSLGGYPVLPETRVDCGASAARLENSNSAFGEQRAPYGKAYFVDVAESRLTLVRDRSSCSVESRRAAQATVLRSGFEEEVVASGLGYPTGFTFLPDGDVLVAGKEGAVTALRGGEREAEPFLDISSRVNDWTLRGLLSIEADPKFASNGYVYVLYAYDEVGSRDDTPTIVRLSRFTADGKTARPESEKVLLGSRGGRACDDVPVASDCIPADCEHAGGDVEFAGDGTIFVTTGDGSWLRRLGTDPLRAQNLDSLAGKLLRVTRDGKGLPTNPFWNGDADANRSKVWAYGLRQPFRLTVRGGRVPYLGDVGSDLREEVNAAPRGANLGWPCYEGGLRAPGFARSTVCRSLYVRGPSAVRFPIHDYPTADRSGRGSVTGGAFYSGTAYPAEYRDAYFFGDWGLGWLRYFRVDERNRLRGSVEQFADGADGPVEIEVGPGANLYYLAINVCELRRIVYKRE